jgi:hypothetical protein
MADKNQGSNTEQGGQQSGQGSSSQGQGSVQTSWPKPQSTSGPTEHRGNRNNYETKVIPKKS